MDDGMTFDMAPEGDKNPFVIVLLKHGKVGQYRCHNDNYARLKALLENLKEQGHVLNAKPLEFKKGNFDPKMMKVQFKPGVLPWTIEDDFKLSIVPMKIDEFKLKLKVGFRPLP